MTVIVDFNSLMFVILLVVNIMLCIVKMPILGLSLGMFTIVLTGSLFMGDSMINVYFSYFLIVIAFSCMIINGLDFRRKK